MKSAGAPAPSDGLSIAWAVRRNICTISRIKVIKTLFATHYHELTELARSRPRVKNFNVAVKEWQSDIIFFHKLVPGGTNRSYGIQVAQLAGLPQEVTAEREKSSRIWKMKGLRPAQSRDCTEAKKIGVG